MTTKATHHQRQIDTDAAAREIIDREAAYTAAKTQRLREARLKRDANDPTLQRIPRKRPTRRV